MSAKLDRESWINLLEKIAEALPREGSPVRLCLIGSAACLLEAMPGRASRDLDVWQPGSDFDRLELKRAVEAAGLPLCADHHADPVTGGDVHPGAVGAHGPSACVFAAMAEPDRLQTGAG